MRPGWPYRWNGSARAERAPATTRGIALVLELHQWTGAAYLAASLAAILGLGLRSKRWLDGAIAALCVGAALHTLALWGLHSEHPPPAVTQLSVAADFMAWVGTVFFLALIVRVRGRGLAVLVAPIAFVSVFAGSLAAPGPELAVERASPLWSHLHVLLASGGLALLGLAGAAGVLYVIHHRAIKAKRLDASRSILPSLESLDRTNTLALGAGFLLISLGLLTGMVWLHNVEGRWWTADRHTNATLAAWGVYAGVVVARYAGRLGARQCAIGSALGFLLMLLAVIGVEVVG